MTGFRPLDASGAAAIGAGAAVVALLLSAAAVVQRAKPAPAPAQRQQSVPFTAGETLTYEVGWSNFLTAGTATVRVEETRPSYGSTAHYVTAEGRPSGLVAAVYPVQYKADTLIDVNTLLPQRFSIFSDERGRRRYRVARFEHGNRQLRYDPQAAGADKLTAVNPVAMPADTQDALSAIFLLRSKALASGARYEVPVFLNGKVHAVELRVSGRERVQSGLGEVDAWRVTAASTADADSGLGDGLGIWISTDSRRLPVKLQATLPVGAFILTLTQAAGTAPR